VFDSSQPHESQHARPPCPSPTPGVHSYSHTIKSQMVLAVKNPPANAGDVRDKDSIPGLGRSNMETHFSIFAWRIPQTEESGKL